jgi:hypothetical protein
MKLELVTLMSALFMISCSESNEPYQDDARENELLASIIQGEWIKKFEDNNKDFTQTDLLFVEDQLIWKDSTVTTQGKYAIIRYGTSDVSYYYNDPAIVLEHFMGRSSMTPGLKDILVITWRGKRVKNRNYRNVKNNEWELINEWESGNAAPPVNEAVYVKFNADNTTMTFEFDGDQKDFVETFSRKQ